MLDSSDIQRIISSIEKESINTELKSFRILFFKDGKDYDRQHRNIAKEIVSFANRFGGKLIFGINDDGSLDKENYNIDQAKQILNQISAYRISPQIEITTQVLEYEGIFLLIVHIPKRSSIPHAFIDRQTSEGDIDARRYYIRTSHGIKTLTDSQLEWLFKNQNDPSYRDEFRIGLEFNKGFEKLDFYAKRTGSDIYWFLLHLKQADKDLIKKDSDNLTRFLMQLLPFCIIKTISDFFSHSWHIHITHGFDRMWSGPIVDPTIDNENKISVGEIPIHGHNFLDELSWDFNHLLKVLYPHKLFMPPQTKIFIDYEKGNSFSHLAFESPVFQINFYFSMLSAGAGMHPRNPFFHANLETDVLQAHDYSIANYSHLDASCLLESNFDFPEYDMSDFNKLYGFYLNLKSLVIEEWDYNEMLKYLPSKDTILIKKKLDEIIHAIK